MANGDPMGVVKQTPNGEVQKIANTPKDGVMKELDEARYGSARNTSKDYTNTKAKSPTG